VTFSQDYEPGLPVVAFKFSESFRKQYPRFQQSWIQTLLRTRGWYVLVHLLVSLVTLVTRLVPDYNLPPECEDIEILRVVVKENMTELVSR